MTFPELTIGGCQAAPKAERQPIP